MRVPHKSRNHENVLRAKVMLLLRLAIWICKSYVAKCPPGEWTKKRELFGTIRSAFCLFEVYLENCFLCELLWSGLRLTDAELCKAKWIYWIKYKQHWITFKKFWWPTYICKLFFCIIWLSMVLQRFLWNKTQHAKYRFYVSFPLIKQLSPLF